MTPKVLVINETCYYFESQQKLADYLGVKVSTIYRWNREGKTSAFNGIIRIEDYNPDKHPIDKVVIMDKNINFIV